MMAKPRDCDDLQDRSMARSGCPSGTIMRPAGERQSAARALHQKSKDNNQNKTRSGQNASTNGLAAPARRTWRGPTPFSPRPKHSTSSPVLVGAHTC